MKKLVMCILAIVLAPLAIVACWVSGLVGAIKRWQYYQEHKHDDTLLRGAHFFEHLK